jgi:hypothetical protein
MVTNPRWANGRPVFGILPTDEGYVSNSAVDWLTQWVDLESIKTKEDLETEIARQFDPEFCDANRLDYLANLTGFTDGYWDSFFTDIQNRLLIQSSLSQLWPARGTVSTISQVLGILGVVHIIREKGSFILGESLLGDILGNVGWEYVIIVPTRYYGSIQEKAIRKAMKLLTPCWCLGAIIYDDTYFSPIELIAVDTFVALQIGDDSIATVR